MSALKESIILNLIMPMAEMLMGTCAMKWRKIILKMNTWSSEEIRAWQNENLRAFVKHAYEHTTYYKNQFDTLGIKPEDIQMSDDADAGLLRGHIINLIYKGDHYSYVVRTDEEIDLIVEDEDLWNMDDYVSLIIPKDKFQFSYKK